MREDGTHRDPGLTQRVHGKQKNASFQVIVLGAGGGPREDTVTGLLVRATQSEWRKGSIVAVDAGTHLSSIVRILQQHMPLYSKDQPPPGYSKIIEDGPFAGIKCPGFSARANALHIFRELMHAFLITHPHLDHLAAMGINTPALEYGREAKAIVALDSTIEAIKTHIFNDSIWPNLSDEGSGVGFVTYRRLKDGGNNRFGTGDARGYVRVCDSLATLCMGVTHGRCKAKPMQPLHHRSESTGWPDAYNFPTRRLSRISDHESYFAAVHSHGHNPSMSSASMAPGQITPGYSALHTPSLGTMESDHFEPVKSSAFFILNEETSNEILVFGDIEPDCVSSSPQNYKVWQTAAPKIANGTLKAIFIECSYDDAVRDTDLYGHLCPRHLIQELLFLGREVAEYKTGKNDNSNDVPASSIEPKRVAEASSADSRKRRRANGSYTISEPDVVLLPPPQSPVVTGPQGGYVGTRSASTSRRQTSNVALAGDVSPISLRGHSPSRSLHPPKHVHFYNTPASPHTSTANAIASPSPVSQALSHPSGLSLHTSMSAFSTTEIGAGRDSGGKEHEMPPDPMKGLTVHIIHVKDTLRDGLSPGQVILTQLSEQSADVGLQCEFDVTDFGESIWI